MSRSSKKVPSYGLHKPSGQARLIVGGKSIYLGKHDSPESYEAYARWVTKLAAQPTPEPVQLAATVGLDDLTINELIVRYLRYADGYYRWKGERTREYSSMVEAVRPLRQLFGTTLVADFGPKSLLLVRQAFVDRGLVRRSINRHIGRIRRVFAWAVAEELIPGAISHALTTVKGLRYGRTEAPESTPTETVAAADIEAVLPRVSPQVAAMIQVQLHAAMRPAEVTIMRRGDIDMSDPALWIYRPRSHKSEWLERPREVYLGPHCQRILQPFLDRPDARARDEALGLSTLTVGKRLDERGYLLSRDPNRKLTVRRSVGTDRRAYWHLPAAALDIFVDSLFDDGDPKSETGSDEPAA